MAVDVSADLQLSDKLTEWFWSFGVYRQSKYPPYAISTSEWLKIVYEIRKELATEPRLLKQSGLHRNWVHHKPANPHWYRLISMRKLSSMAFRRRRRRLSPPLAGGEPALFMDPVTIRQQRAAQGVSILTHSTMAKTRRRVSAASFMVRRPAAGRVLRRQSRFQFNPTRNRKDLLHALARGFDSECWATRPKAARIVDVDKLQAEITTFQATNYFQRRQLPGRSPGL